MLNSLDWNWKATSNVFNMMFCVFWTEKTRVEIETSGIYGKIGLHAAFQCDYFISHRLVHKIWSQNKANPNEKKEEEDGKSHSFM